MSQENVDAYARRNIRGRRGAYGPERWTNDARRSMIEHDFLLTVARSPEEPFDFLIDLRNAAQGEPYCREAEKTSDAPIGPAKV